MIITAGRLGEQPCWSEPWTEFSARTAWEKTRDYLMTLPAHIETALHQSLHDERFRFVNIAQWTSE